MLPICLEVYSPSLQGSKKYSLDNFILNVVLSTFHQLKKPDCTS